MNELKPIAKYTTFEEMLDEKGYFLYTNLGYSMMPLLRPRKDIIEIRKKNSDRCRKYDIILYKRHDYYVIHRILKVLPGGRYIIAGDHNFFLEKDITDEDILGVVTRVIRNGKSINMDDIVYQGYVHLWCDFYPVRMGVIAVLGKTKTFLRRINGILD